MNHGAQPPKPTRVGPAASSDDSEIFEHVRRAQAGDRAAFAWLHREHIGRVVRHLQVLLGPCVDVDDAAQQVFVEAYKGLAKFNFSSRFSTWLHGIAIRVALNALRSHRRRNRAMASAAAQLAADESVVRGPESAIAARASLVELHGYLQELEPQSRMAFVLYYVEECDLGEVAQHLGLSAGATWARIKRARERLAMAIGARQVARGMGRNS